MEIVVGQQAVVDIAVAFLRARTFGLLLFRDRVRESCGGQSDNNGGVKVHLGDVRSESGTCSAPAQE